MIYNIHFFRAEQEIGNSPWQHGLEKAKEHAKSYMKINNADRVEVRDDNGKLCFHLPRLLKAANPKQ